MKYKLIKEINEQYNAIFQILTNRGIDYNQIYEYLYTTDNDINSMLTLGEDKLKAAAVALIKAIKNQENCFLLVDCDCDGFTSAAILINYLHELFPAWVENNLKYFLHDSKQHGLSDCIDYILERNFKLVIVPDAGSNDYEYHKILKNNGIPVIILDHHEAEKISEDAIVINNQLSNYPNKDFSGAGITWQFCRYLDTLFGKDQRLADDFIDLVALGNDADMMSMKSIETKHIINKGFEDENLRNPFIAGMAQKNSYSLGNKITPMGAAFYIVPFVNSMVRSGTLEEKDLLFKSMLKYEAFKEIPSNKRGHKVGELEKLVEQALRTATNVKNRQTRIQDAAMETFENMLEEQNLMQHKVLLFLCEPGVIDKNVAGLCANKMMAKYQRPCCILTKVTTYENTNTPPWEENTSPKIVTYQGSARGCDKVGINNFKDICEKTNAIMYAEGHQGAFGLGIKESEIDNFISATDEILKDMSSEPIYYVDYIYKNNFVKKQDILDIASLNNLWGKDLDESLIALENLEVTPDMVTLMGLEKGRPTLKITLPTNGISIIKFGSSQEEYESFCSSECGNVIVNIVGKCNKNEWMGNVTPQILIEDYEIIKHKKYTFLEF